MRVKTSEFTSALAKVRAMAAETKSVAGVCLDIGDSTLSICYAEARRTFIEQIDAETDFIDNSEETGELPDVEGKIVVDYARLCSVIDSCQPTGAVSAEYLEFIFEPNNTLIVKAEKSMSMAGGDDGEATSVKVSAFNQKLNWFDVNGSTKIKILGTAPYGDIITGADGAACDTWDVSDIRAIISRAMPEKGKILCFSPSRQSAFSLGTSHLVYVPTPEFSTAISLSSSAAAALNNMLGKISGACNIRVYTSEDSRMINFVTEDGKIGITFEMAPIGEMHIKTMSGYTGLAYDQIQITMLKDPLHNVIKCAMASDSSAKTTLTFGASEMTMDGVKMQIKSSDAKASTSNDFSVECQVMDVAAPDITGALDEIKIQTSLKVLDTILQSCNNVYIGIDAQISADNKYFIRISDIDPDKLGDEDRAGQLEFQAYTMADNKKG